MTFAQKKGGLKRKSEKRKTPEERRGSFLRKVMCPKGRKGGWGLVYFHDSGKNGGGRGTKHEKEQ